MRFISHVHRLYILNWHGFYRMYIAVAAESNVVFVVILHHCTSCRLQINRLQCQCHAEKMNQ